MIIDRRNTLPPIYNQGSDGICVGASGAAVLFSALGKEINPVHLYNEAQKLDIWPGEDYDGTSIRAGIRALHQRHSNLSAQQIDANDLAAMESAIIKGCMWFSIKVGSGFKQNFKTHFDDPQDFEGGNTHHALVIVGATATHWIVRNSWGTAWGEKGYCFIRKDVLPIILAPNSNPYLITRGNKPQMRKKSKKIFMYIGIGVGVAIAAGGAFLYFQ